MIGKKEELMSRHVNRNLCNKVQVWTADVLSYDKARINSSKLLKENCKDTKSSSFEYTCKFGRSLVKPHMQRRCKNQQGIQHKIVQNMKYILEI